MNFYFNYFTSIEREQVFVICHLSSACYVSFPEKVDSPFRSVMLCGAHCSQLKVCANRMQNQASLNYAEVQPKLNNKVVTAHRSQKVGEKFVIVWGIE